MRYGRLCDGIIRRNVLLGGTMPTDLVELRFRLSNRELVSEHALWTLGVIISRKLAEYHGIEQSEISFGVTENNQSLFIFDSNIGGAGYSTLLPLYKNEVFDEAYEALRDRNENDQNDKRGCVCEMRKMLD